MRRRGAPRLAPINAPSPHPLKRSNVVGEDEVKTPTPPNKTPVVSSINSTLDRSREGCWNEGIDALIGCLIKISERKDFKERERGYIEYHSKRIESERLVIIIP